MEKFDTMGDKGMDKKGFQKKKACKFCSSTEMVLDYKDKNLLFQYITERSKILPRRMSYMCAKHQRQLTVSIKRARHIALLSYTSAQW